MANATFYTAPCDKPASSMPDSRRARHAMRPVIHPRHVNDCCAQVGGQRQDGQQLWHRRRHGVRVRRRPDRQRGRSQHQVRVLVALVLLPRNRSHYPAGVSSSTRREGLYLPLPAPPRTIAVSTYSWLLHAHLEPGVQRHFGASWHCNHPILVHNVADTAQASAGCRAILMNVNEPETRGVALALHVVLDDLGKARCRLQDPALSTSLPQNTFSIVPFTERRQRAVVQVPSVPESELG